MAEHFERFWAQALVTVSQAEGEVTKTIQRIADVAGWGPEEVKRQAREFSERLTSQRKDLERSVEEGVRKALTRVRLPRRDELQELQARMDRVASRLDALAGRR